MGKTKKKANEQYRVREGSLMEGVWSRVERISEIVLSLGVGE